MCIIWQQEKKQLYVFRVVKIPEKLGGGEQFCQVFFGNPFKIFLWKKRNKKRECGICSFIINIMSMTGVQTIYHEDLNQRCLRLSRLQNFWNFYISRFIYWLISFICMITNASVPDPEPEVDKSYTRSCRVLSLDKHISHDGSSTSSL